MFPLVFKEVSIAIQSTDKSEKLETAQSPFQMPTQVHFLLHAKNSNLVKEAALLDLQTRACDVFFLLHLFFPVFNQELGFHLNTNIFNGTTAFDRFLSLFPKIII